MDFNTNISPSTITNNSANLSVDIKNCGNEDIYNVEISTIQSYRLTTTGFLKCEDLKIDDTANMNVNVELDNKSSPGNYPIILMIKYDDSYNNTFSIVKLSMLIYKNTDTPNMDFYFSDIDKLFDSKNVFLKIYNYDNSFHESYISVLTPIEIDTTFKTNSILVEPLSERSIEFALEKDVKVSDKIYSIVSFLEYEYDGFHHTIFTDEYFTVSNEKRNTPVLLYIAIICFFALLIFYVYYKIMEKDDLK